MTPFPSEKGSTLKGKNLFPNSFLLEKTPFSEGSKNNFDRVVFLEIVSIFLKHHENMPI